MPSQRHSIDCRAGLTLLELLLASTIMALLVAALASMASAVYRTNEYSQGYGEAAQHARVVLQRITRKINKATANANYPGAWVIHRTVGGATFPEVLVVWHPTGAAIDAAGQPRVKELVIYCPSGTAPNELL